MTPSEINPKGIYDIRVESITPDGDILRIVVQILSSRNVSAFPQAPQQFEVNRNNIVLGQKGNDTFMVGKIGLLHYVDGQPIVSRIIRKVS